MFTHERPEIAKLTKKYASFTYDKTYGPWVQDSKAELDKRANCQRFVRDAIEILNGMIIPNTFLSKEIYEGRGLFFPVELGEEIEGDVFLLGPNVDVEEFDTRRIHTGFYSGERSEDDEPIIMHFHGNGSKKGLKKFPLSMFSDENHQEEYGKLWGIRRLDPDALLTFDPQTYPSVREVLSFFSDSNLSNES